MADWNAEALDRKPKRKNLRTIVVFGDFMPAGSPWPGPPRGAQVDPKLQHMMETADAVVGNLETPLVAKLSTWNWLSAALLHALSEADFDAWLEALHIRPPKLLLSLANNHCYDQGVAGLQYTMESLRARGISILGADGAQPNVTPLSAFGMPKVGLAAWTHWLNFDPEVSAASPPVAIARHADILQAAPTLRQDFTGLLIGLPHWGYEFDAFPDARCVQQAETYFHAGFDVLLGNHSHTPQPLAFLGPERKNLCAFSLGDFNGFPAPAWLQFNHVRIGQIITLEIDEDRLHSYRVDWVEWDPWRRSMRLREDSHLAWLYAGGKR